MLKKIILIIILTLFICISSVTFAYNKNIDNEIPISSASIVNYYDFIEHASDSNVYWQNVYEFFDFGGELSDNRGFACYRENIGLEDGNIYDRVLETHPQWISRGIIRGTYPEVTISANTELHIIVGFIDGAAATDGVKFGVSFEVSATRENIKLLEIDAFYDNELNYSALLLDNLYWVTGRFQIWVDAGENSGQDWAAWVRAEIRPKIQSVIYDFIENADDQNVRWMGYPNEKELVFGVEDNPDGFACYKYNLRLEDENIYERILETHPQWASDGRIWGIYPESEIIPDTEIYVSVGFIKGAERTDGATFTVYFYSQNYLLEVLTIDAEYDKIINYKAASLNKILDLGYKNGNFILSVDAGESSGQDWAVWTIAQLKSSPILPGDFDIDLIQPVQVLYLDNTLRVPLVREKSTAFRVWIDSSFPVPLDTHVKLSLPEGQWDTKPPDTGGIKTDVPSDYKYPEIWGPVTIKPGYDFIILPHVPPGDIYVDWSYPDNPAGIIRGRESDSGWFGPDIRVVPRPKPDVEAVDYSVALNVYHNVIETREDNNEGSGSCHNLITSGEYRIGVYRIIGGEMPAWGDPRNDGDFSNTWGGEDCPTWPYENCWDGNNRNCVSNTPSPTSVINAFKNNFDYLLGTYPIADSKIRFDYLGGIIWDVEEESRGEFLTRIYSLIQLPSLLGPPRYTWAAGVDCGCCGGTCPGPSQGVGWNTKAVFIGNNSRNIHNLAHEFAHVLVGAPDCYSCDGCPEENVMCGTCDASDGGFWVNKWWKYPTLRTCYYMDYSDFAPYCWAKNYPTFACDGTDYSDSYFDMSDELENPEDPDTLLVRGVINKNNTCSFKPFYIIRNTTYDVEPWNEDDADNDFYFVLCDSQNNILSKTGFTPSFLNTGRQPDWDPEELDSEFFSYKIEWKKNTKRIEFQDKSGVVLASRIVSEQLPNVEVISPNGGEVYNLGEKITVKWDANDLNNDNLTATIIIGDKDGEICLPINIDISGNEYVIDTNIIEIEDEYTLKIIITDGVNSAEDISDGTFTIEESQVKIYLVHGGFRVVLGIENIGEQDMEFPYSIDIIGLVFMGAHTEGVSDIVPSGSQWSLYSNFVFGFGPVEIKIIVGTETITVNGFMFGPYIYIERTYPD